VKNRLWIIGSVVLGLASQIAIAQAPAGSTGQCKDGTYTSAAKKAGACSGHKGVQSWFASGSGASPAAAPAQAPSKASAPGTRQPRAATPAPTAAPTPARTAPASESSAAPARTAPVPESSAAQTPAAGGGPGMVWVNLPTKVYHCAGTRFYGTTKNGKYMTEAEATAMGARPDHGKACSK